MADKRLPDLYQKVVSLRKTPFAEVPSSIRPLDFNTEIIGADETDNPVLKVLLDRKQEGSGIRNRSDSHTVALVIEGGGMTGVISAGMCVFLESAGLIRSFDRIYGCSAGAIAAAYAASGQGGLGSTNFQDLINFNFINPAHVLWKQPIVDMNLLFDVLIKKKKPIDFERLQAGPELRMVATTLENPEVRVLKDFTSAEDVIDAARASSSLPILSGRPREYRGEYLVDGGLIEPIPYRAAIEEGATHILVLRPRKASYRKEDYNFITKRWAEKNSPPTLWPLIDDREDIYNREVEDLEDLIFNPLNKEPFVEQVVIPEANSQLVNKLTTKRTTVDAGFKLGMKSMAGHLTRKEIDIFWTPAVFTD